MDGRTEADLAEAIRASYGESVRTIIPKHEWPDGSGLFLVERYDGPPWVLRRFGSSRPFDRVAGDGAVLAHVADHELPAERVVRTVDGAFAVRFDDTSLLLTDYVRGKAANATEEELRRLGDTLGRLHALRQPPDDPWLQRVAGSTPREDLAASRATLDELDVPLTDAQRAERGRLEAAVAATSDCDDCPKALIHPDPHLGNTVRSDTGALVLVDWDGAGQGPRVASLGWTLFDAGLRHPDGIEAVLDGWCRHLALTSSELDRLGDAIRFRPLTHAVRSFAARVKGQDDEPRQWADHYDKADAFAERARAAVAAR